MPRIIEEIEFRNPSRARDQLNRLSGGLPEAIVARIQVLLASVPDPDQSLHFLEHLRIENPSGFDRLSNSPTALSYLITVFSYSKFLSETVLRYPEWLGPRLNCPDNGNVGSLSKKPSDARLRDGAAIRFSSVLVKVCRTSVVLFDIWRG